LFRNLLRKKVEESLSEKRDSWNDRFRLKWGNAKPPGFSVNNSMEINDFRRYWYQHYHWHRDCQSVMRQVWFWPIDNCVLFEKCVEMSQAGRRSGSVDISRSEQVSNPG
jgi:hypothetical protein